MGTDAVNKGVASKLCCFNRPVGLYVAMLNTIFRLYITIVSAVQQHVAHCNTVPRIANIFRLVKCFGLCISLWNLAVSP